ncbi:hypothetical protein N7450_003508 [Penicillium hetheringtonii]|uniref:Zn(2)-C6 fungal-type domain-containing protein n=1 Tax=Penicillium hetheringtonii TaxID=911720 RepID=A0AAD6DYJ0_9EURO|nr:hypothetical protein N7450_003508 [Penicillium hetheringtonii]
MSDAYPSGRSASAHACLACRRSKVRCNYDPAGQPPCQRRFDKLEKRIDSLISNISQRQNEDMLPTQTPPRDMAIPSSAAKKEFENTHSNTRYQQFENAVPDPPISLPAESMIPGENVWPQAEAAEALCYLFRNEMSMFFPFVTPPKGSVAVLQSNYPCLLKAMILAASYQNRSLQLRRGAALTEELAKRLLIDGEKSRDILQALLLTIAWYHGHLKANPQMTNLIHLTLAVLADLGFDKPAHPNDRRTVIFDGSRSSYGFAEEGNSMDNEDRRTLLGCFYVTSVASAVFRRVDAIPYSRHLNQALEILAEAREHPADELLVHHVRLQSLVEQIAQVAPFDDPQGPHSSWAPITMHIRYLDQQLTGLTQSATKLNGNHVWLIHIHAARIFLYEAGLYDSLWQNANTGARQQRLDTMWKCLASTKALFEVFLSMPDHTIFTASYALWGHLAYALLIASRLCLSKVEGWDVDLVRTELDFSQILEMVTQKTDQGNAFARTHWLRDSASDEMMDRVKMKTRRVQTWFNQYFPRILSQNGPIVGMGPDPSFLLGIDDMFWEELIIGFQPGGL